MFLIDNDGALLWWVIHSDSTRPVRRSRASLPDGSKSGINSEKGEADVSADGDETDGNIEEMRSCELAP